MRCAQLPKEGRFYLGFREGGPLLQMAAGHDRASGWRLGAGAM